MANNFKKGTLTDDEKRKIEQLIRFENYASIAKKLNRNPVTIRKFCQRKGITKDNTSIERRVDNKIKRSPKFEELNNILSSREMDLAVHTYSEIMKQFGGDVLPTEEEQVIDYCIVSAMLNRALAREKQILKDLEKQNELRVALEKEKGSLEDDDDEGKEDWYEKIESVDLRIAGLADELKEVRKNQLSFFDSKQKATRSMGADRERRAEQISKLNESWSDFVSYFKKNENFRRQCGLELEKMRLGINEEYIRLASVPHEFVDGEMDFPILNSEIIEAYDQTLAYEAMIKEMGKNGK